MTNEIVARAVNDLQRIGLPGSAARLQTYIADLEKKASAVQPLDREHWRYVFAGQFLAAQISIGDGMLPEDLGHACRRAESLLTELAKVEGTK